MKNGGLDMATAKEQIARLLEEQPEDSSFEEIVRELAFGMMVQRGLMDSDKGRIIPDEEMRRRIRQWRE